ncbi:MAG: TRAP transporter small permease subunit [Spirochaetaceae bacterium]|jgi:TRAP-type C4-dicarboxylate transport system permease small subunit|nr:TRAP transporter small permease subunit [Spirochaetaceae bacterium]
MKVFDTISDFFEKIGMVLTTGILLIVFLLVFFGVIFRLINFRFAMYEELSRWGLVGMTFIGASVALKQKQHVGINMLVQALPLGAGKVCVIIAHLAVMATLGISAWFSGRAALAAQGMTGDIVPVPMMYIKFTLPLGMVMMLFHLLAGLIRIFKSRDINKILIGS